MSPKKFKPHWAQQWDRNSVAASHAKIPVVLSFELMHGKTTTL